MVIGIILLSLLLVLIVLWVLESRIFAYALERIVWPPRKGKPIHLDKEDLFPEGKILEENWEVILEELVHVLQDHQIIPRFHEVDQTSNKISFDDGPAWRTIMLKAYDTWYPQNSKLFPKTVGMLKDMGSVSTVAFSMLEPHSEIPPHRGVLCGFNRYHLGLTVPTNPSDCYIIVKDTRYEWQIGESIMFDDTWLHWVKNESAESRVVLLLDIKKRAASPWPQIHNFLLSLVKRSPVFARSAKGAELPRINQEPAS